MGDMRFKITSNHRQVYWAGDLQISGALQYTQLFPWCGDSILLASIPDWL